MFGQHLVRKTITAVGLETKQVIVGTYPVFQDVFKSESLVYQQNTQLITVIFTRQKEIPVGA
jgi:hypothetical protein